MEKNRKRRSRRSAAFTGILSAACGAFGICALSVTYARTGSSAGADTQPETWTISEQEVANYQEQEAAKEEADAIRAFMDAQAKEAEADAAAKFAGSRQELWEQGFTDRERYLLAKLAMAEAEDEDTEGKALVMRVVLNRVMDSGFPGTIEEVIFQPGQFSPISNGRFDRVEPDADCWEALDLITMDQWDSSFGATYFESKSNSTWHSENLEFLFQHGRHYFYKGRKE